MSIKIAICDDEEHFVNQVLEFCISYTEEKVEDKSVSTIELESSMSVTSAMSEYKNKEFEISCFTDSKALLKSAETKKYDILLLDVKMPEMDGLELGMLIKEYNENVLFIFITSHEEFAYDAAQIEAIGYLRKPAAKTQFIRLMDRALMVFQGIQEQIALDNQYINIVDGYKKIQLHVKEIVVMEKYGNSIILTTKTGKEYKYYVTIKSMEERLSKKRFIKISSGCIINMEYIKEIASTIVVLNAGEEEKTFTIGRTNHKEVKHIIKQYLTKKNLNIKK